jgi:hypothetical protein
MTPRLLQVTADAIAAVDRAFDSLSDREKHKKMSDLNDLIRSAQQKVVASRKKLDDVQRQMSGKDVTVSVSLREDLERAIASLKSARSRRCTLLCCPRRHSSRCRVHAWPTAG